MPEVTETLSIPQWAVSSKCFFVSYKGLAFVFPTSLPLILSPGANVIGEQPKAKHVNKSKEKWYENEKS